MRFAAPVREVGRVFIHCSASDADLEGRDLIEAVYKWHVVERKWSAIGYHYMIDKKGNLLPGRSLEKIPAAQRGHNEGTIAIMVHGKDSFETIQLQKLAWFCQLINEEYRGKVSFHGHCEVSPKTCPNFDYREALLLDRFGRMP